MEGQMLLTTEAVRAIDSTGQASEILGLPDHLRDALWRVDSARIAPVEAPLGLIVAGMGGSAIGGRLAVGALSGRLTRPMAVTSGYALPAWAGPDTLVLCSSYSGDTEETLAVYDAAKAAGAPRLVATTGGALAEGARADGVPVIPLPGGFQPRAAVGYALVCALEAAALCGAAPHVREELEAAAVLAGSLGEGWGPAAAEDNEAKALARALHGTIPVVAGAGLLAPVAYRWKCQVNENAELPAFSSELPELDHNEIVGWDAADGRLAAVFLEEPDAPEAIARRIQVTAELVEAGASRVLRVASRGDAPLERIVSLVLLGDLVSLYLAILRGVDPAPVRAIDQLKARLAQ
jgi:glucose/mannose-6-phosphate isomerase